MPDMEEQEQVAPELLEEADEWNKTFNKALKKKTEVLQEQAIKDPLTGLYNRRFVVNFLEKSFALAKRKSGERRKERSSLSVLLIDVDSLKGYNDKFGHGEGDLMLKTLTEVGGITLRESDVFGRYGGDEFIVILPDTDLEEAKTAAETFRAMIDKEMKEGKKHELKNRTKVELKRDVKVSIGISSVDGSIESARDLINQADQAMYVAKGERGRSSSAFSSNGEIELIKEGD